MPQRASHSSTNEPRSRRNAAPSSPFSKRRRTKSSCPARKAAARSAAELRRSHLGRVPALQVAHPNVAEAHRVVVVLEAERAGGRVRLPFHHLTVAGGADQLAVVLH